LDGLRCLFVHGSPSDPTYGYVYPDTDLSSFAGFEADVIFMGHTHRPFVRRNGDYLFVNVGSCGLPRDGDPRGSVCLFDTHSRSAEILRFDISQSSEAALSRYRMHDSVAAALKRLAAAPAHG
jgi:predicted phosphodiesterase